MLSQKCSMYIKKILVNIYAPIMPNLLPIAVNIKNIFNILNIIYLVYVYN